jgi:hypothetical protein
MSLTQVQNGMLATGAISSNTVSFSANTISGNTLIANTVSNTAFQTGSVENYMSSQGLGLGMRNRIINGDMRIDQRYAGTSKTFTGTSQAQGGNYVLDRWSFSSFGTYPSGTYATVQQVSDAPSGFYNSYKITANQSLTIGSSNARGVWINQAIEGYNFLDCWNQPLTFSFWVKSSNIGTYSLTFQGTSSAASYASSYTINSANTWEKKTVSFIHSTSLYTPDASNGNALSVVFGLLGDPTWIGTSTANQWVSGNIPYLHNCKNLFDTSGATWQITGVQLEKGSVATPFEYRQYGHELALCQRYYQYWGGTTTYARVAPGFTVNSTSAEAEITAFPVQMRTAPSLGYSSVGHWTVGLYNSSVTCTGISIGQSTPTNCALALTVSGGLTANWPFVMNANNTTDARLTFSAEL